MTKRKLKWVLVLESRLPLSGEDDNWVVGPFHSEEEAREYANSSACDGDGHLGMRVMPLLRPGSLIEPFLSMSHRIATSSSVSSGVAATCTDGALLAPAPLGAALSKERPGR